MKFGKFLLTVLTLSLLVSSSACNFDTELSFGEPEAPSADINKPTEEVTQIPTEEPTEKPTEPIITIDGITFDKMLKAKLNFAKTQAEICEILGKEGTLVEVPEVVYYFYINNSQNPGGVGVKFANTGDGYFVCEDIKITNDEFAIDISNRDPAILDQITVGKSFKEVLDITGYSGSYICGNSIVYEWNFGDNIKIRAEFGHNPKNNNASLSLFYLTLWDYDQTKTMADINREKLELGQVVADINEMFGQEGEEAAQGNRLWWDFEDGSSLVINAYMDTSDPSVFEGGTFHSDRAYRYAGSSYIILKYK